MFKKTLICFIMLIPLLLVGCANTEQNFLEYQTSGFETRANIDISGNKYSVIIKKTADNQGKVTFEEPERLKGTSLEIEGESFYYCVGSLRLPLKNMDNNQFASILQLFQLSKDNVTAIQSDLMNGVKVNVITFKQPENQVILYLATETNIPLRMETNIDSRSVTINFFDFAVQ